MRLGATKSAARIANITGVDGDADASKGANDNLIYDALNRAPAGRPFTHIIMGRRSLSQLRKSRTAASPTGAPVDFPTEVSGVKIIVTDAIGETEALVA